MKIPSGALTFVLAAVVAIVSIVTLRAIAQASAQRPTYGDKKLVLIIGHGKDDYAELKDKTGTEFKKALGKLGEDQYQIGFKHEDNNVEENFPPPPKASIKTDKVTTSELAKNAPPGDPHVTQRITSNNPAEIQSVLSTLKTPK